MKKEAMLYEKLANNLVHCFLCNHHCKIKPGDFGLCSVRKNVAGNLETLVYGKVIASGVDPIEKKPLYHFLPGSLAYSIATIGCNFKCDFCQNWQISQSKGKDLDQLPGKELKPQTIVSQAQANKCKSIAYTYTEPTIFFEYVYDTAKLAKKNGLYNIFVTNGYMTKQAIDQINPYLDAANVDLKSFRDDFYKKICRGRLQPVLDSIAYMKKLGIWVEVTTLVVPGQNDSEQELRQIAEFIASIDKSIPWHISRFHPDYKDTENQPTSQKTLDLAFNIGPKNGLKYVYLGNIAEEKNTVCDNCGEIVIKRDILGCQGCKVKDNKCFFCGTPIEGLFV
ncbi:MAG: AmmeMemoRadiSam system radical SAM enzyme [Candidatus Omnitrophica bacterium]|nr:AmmeMemoRadiSam system radical SAM enzyme [Candidatus Omnitrophota bacterium]